MAGALNKFLIQKYGPDKAASMGPPPPIPAAAPKPAPEEDLNVTDAVPMADENQRRRQAMGVMG